MCVLTILVYEYVLEIADRPSRLGFPEGTLTSVHVYYLNNSQFSCVYEQETIKLNIPIIISLSSTTENEPL
jgi:hypothetical protein